MQTVPGWASASSRAAMLTLSPKMSSPSTITSPRLTPMRNSSRRSGGIGSLTARRSLHFEGAIQRVDDAREIPQLAVPCRADDPSTLRDERVDGAADVSDRPVRSRLVLAPHPAQTDHLRV